MNEGALVVAAHVLRQMRAEAAVLSALEHLGIDREYGATLRLRAEAVGLNRIGHSMNVYRDLLGEPLEEHHIEHRDPYQRRRFVFSLPTWPELVLLVHGSDAATAGLDAHVTGGLSFARARDLGRRRPFADSGPWSIVEDDLMAAGDVEVVHEWYPQKDYQLELATAKGDVGCYIMQFDFGLLQAVVPFAPR